MALKALLDSLDGLPDEIKPEYRRRDDGKFVLDVEPVGGLALEDVKGLKTSLSTERQAREEAARTLRDFKSKLGDHDLDSLLEARTRLEALGSDATIEKRAEELAKTREQKLLQRFAAEKEATEKSRDAAVGQLERILKRDAILNAVKEAKGSAPLLEPILERRVKMVAADDGTYRIQVLDSDGRPAIGDAAGNPQTIPGLLAELRSDTNYAAAFSGDGARGSGARPGTGNADANSNSGAKKVISRSDKRAMSANLEGIADGSVLTTD